MKPIRAFGRLKLRALDGRRYLESIMNINVPFYITSTQAIVTQSERY